MGKRLSSFAVEPCASSKTCDNKCTAEAFAKALHDSIGNDFKNIFKCAATVNGGARDNKGGKTAAIPRSNDTPAIEVECWWWLVLVRLFN